MMTASRPRNSGNALLAALAFVGITAIIVAGVGGLVVSHVSRASVESDYSRAIHLAEAGVNYEMRWISQNLYSNPNAIHHGFPGPGQNGPETFNLPGGTVTVKVVNEDGNGPWIPGQRARIVATGRSNGIERTIEVVAERENGFNPILAQHHFLLFGTESVRLNGAVSRIYGNVGTNGTMTFNGARASNVSGSIVFMGSSPTVSGANVFREPYVRQWPTVDQLAMQYFPNGMQSLRTQNNNDNIRMFHPSDSTFSLSAAVPAGLSKSTWTLTNNIVNASSITQNTFAGDRPMRNGGWRYATQNEGLHNKRVLIFPPGDYYFESVNVSSGNSAFLIDNANGPVNIWVGGTVNSNDTFGLTTILTDPDRPDTYRIYYNKTRNLGIAGNKTTVGMIYMVTGSPSGGDYTISGTSEHHGGVIARRIVVSGTSQIYAASTEGGSGLNFANGPTTGYVFAGNWREVSQHGTSVFNDGTRY